MSIIYNLDTFSEFDKYKKFKYKNTDAKVFKKDIDINLYPVLYYKNIYNLNIDTNNMVKNYRKYLDDFLLELSLYKLDLDKYNSIDNLYILTYTSHMKIDLDIIYKFDEKLLYIIYLFNNVCMYSYYIFKMYENLYKNEVILQNNNKTLHDKIISIIILSYNFVHNKIYDRYPFIEYIISNHKYIKKDTNNYDKSHNYKLLIELQFKIKYSGGDIYTDINYYDDCYLDNSIDIIEKKQKNDEKNENKINVTFNMYNVYDVPVEKYLEENCYQDLIEMDTLKFHEKYIKKFKGELDKTVKYAFIYNRFYRILKYLNKFNIKLNKYFNEYQIESINNFITLWPQINFMNIMSNNNFSKLAIKEFTGASYYMFNIYNRAVKSYVNDSLKIDNNTFDILSKYYEPNYIHIYKNLKLVKNIEDLKTLGTHYLNKSNFFLKIFKCENKKNDKTHDGNDIQQYKSPTNYYKPHDDEYEIFLPNNKYLDKTDYKEPQITLSNMYYTRYKYIVDKFKPNLNISYITKGYKKIKNTYEHEVKFKNGKVSKSIIDKIDNMTIDQLISIHRYYYVYRVNAYEYIAPKYFYFYSYECYDDEYILTNYPQSDKIFKEKEKIVNFIKKNNDLFKNIFDIQHFYDSIVLIRYMTDVFNKIYKIIPPIEKDIVLYRTSMSKNEFSSNILLSDASTSITHDKLFGVFVNDITAERKEIKKIRSNKKIDDKKICNKKICDKQIKKKGKQKSVKKDSSNGSDELNGSNELNGLNVYKFLVKKGSKVMPIIFNTDLTTFTNEHEVVLLKGQHIKCDNNFLCIVTP